MYFIEPAQRQGLIRGFPNPAILEKQMRQQVCWSIEKSWDILSITSGLDYFVQKYTLLLNAPVLLYCTPEGSVKYVPT